MEATQAILLKLAESQEQMQHQQDRTNQAIAQLTGQIDQLSEKIDAFVHEFQPVLSNHDDRLSRIKAAIEANADAIGRLTRNAESDRTEMRATHQRMDSMNTRLDALVNYLMQKDVQ